jgi:hypothetical protein
MRGPLGVLMGALVVGGLVAWLALSERRSAEVVEDLVAALPSARAQRPSPDVFRVVDASLAGQSKRAILVKGSSRLVYAVTVPDGAALRVSLGLSEDAWTVAGDGVLFRILLAAPRENDQRQLLNRTLAPSRVPADRGWQDVEFDLSSYAGQTVELFFNTNAGPQENEARRGDLALWGAPRIVAPES